MKKILAFLLVACMCVCLLAACSSSEEGNTAETGDNTGDEVDDEEIAEIRMTMLDINGKGETAGNMVAALNEITEKEIGVHVDIDFIAMGDYATKVSLAISGGEELDIVGLTSIPGADFSTMYSTGQLVDITEYLQQDYAADMMALVEPYIGAYTVNGSIYGIPAYRNFATGHYIVMRKDILDELNLTDKATSMTSWPEFEEILQAVTDAYTGSGMYATSKGDAPSVMAMSDYDSDLSGDFSDGEYYDVLGDQTNAIMAYQDGSIVYRTQSEATKARMEKLAEWAQAGYIYPDSAYDSQNMGSDLMRSGVTFSYMADSEYGIEATIADKTGYEVVANEVAPCIIKSSSVTSWGMAVTVNSDDVEASVKFMSLLYSNADLMNTIMLGVEGEDYVVNDEGIADYVTAGDPNSANWHGSDWIFGNQFLVYPWAGKEADYRDICLQQTEEAPTSNYLGFSLDSTELSDSIAALSAVYDQYYGALNCGAYTEQMFDEYASALESAGVESYIETIQSQLDAWQNG